MSFAEPSRIEPDDNQSRGIALAILLLPLTLPLFLFLCLFVFLPVGLFAFLFSFTGELLFYLSMWNDGRTLTRRRLRRRLAAGETGTLIIEYPMLAQGRTHAWWTPDDISTLAPLPIPDRSSDEYQDAVLDLMEQDQSHPWDAWCWQEYTSTSQGKASLLRVWNGKKYQEWLARHYPSIPIVETTSEIVRQLEIEAQQKSHQPQP
ncbi:hypothetical protein [Gimesia panareensis]|uniref:hypothetical protein n=1 Tax=Gimesia panareensis TaxID=2527978 RepID=UPI00118B0EE7|nr:hypothetical protein [Gimesia panareensis]QDU48308.1 hypothetical protein Pan110_06210 [Gimesia panareensis]